MPTILQRYLGANIAEDIVKIYYNGEQVFPLDITVSPDTGALVFTAYVPSLDTTLNLDSGQVTFSGFAPSLDTAINTGFGAMTFTGYAPEIPTTTLLDGIVAYYNFDEASGNLLDQVGSADGTVTGATQNVTGKIGTAYSFDGVNDYVDLGDPSALNGMSEITISAWIYPTVLPTGGIQMIVAKYGSTLALQSFYLALFDAGGDNTTQLRYFINTTANNASTNLSINTWYHAVFTWDGSDGRAILYLNGSSDLSELSGVTGTTRSNTENVYIGTRIESAKTSFFNGTIDEVGIWNRVLTNDEITELYNSGTGKTHPFT